MISYISGVSDSHGHSDPGQENPENRISPAWEASSSRRKYAPSSDTGGLSAQEEYGDPAIILPTDLIGL
ncbi:hypothetical protein PGT21_011762 [Puccinia graminis f. sp. tritici]|uniref:Uncharacterized protein n=1 Tax=Puccinia graminis f. sp. tritici TaxID=56615 RepID=A0A5B0N466_PUCGR|nr:hypothetical protein PGTUg99_029941 [Puccinia graminis f. sp. tritici]KAA1094158.1 hypothetical protein PGT21_011762 [Puccinia graminis f. sp. tritici]